MIKRRFRDSLPRLFYYQFFTFIVTSLNSLKYYLTLSGLLLRVIILSDNKLVEKSSLSIAFTIYRVK